MTPYLQNWSGSFQYCSKPTIHSELFWYLRTLRCTLSSSMKWFVLVRLEQNESKWNYRNVQSTHTKWNGNTSSIRSIQICPKKSNWYHRNVRSTHTRCNGDTISLRSLRKCPASRRRWSLLTPVRTSFGTLLVFARSNYHTSRCLHGVWWWDS
jgi:hypothetical protein